MFGKKIQNKIRRIKNYTCAVLLSVASIYYITHMRPLSPAWILIVPWVLTIVFFLLWRLTPIQKYTSNDKPQKSKVKRYR